jgi:cyclic beta-1,2-glucan synthetase
MYQAAIEGLLGLRRHGTTFSVNPSIPGMWPQFSISWKVGASRYAITVLNPEHRCRGVRSAHIDGRLVDAQAIPLSDDGNEHDVTVVLGEPSVPAAATQGVDSALRTH